jgi:hypothetical protein
VSGDEWRQMSDVMARRNGTTESLLEQVVRGHPYPEIFPNILSYPKNVETQEGYPLQLFMMLAVDRLTSVDQKAQEYEMHYEIQWYYRDCRVQTDCVKLYVDGNSPYFARLWKPEVRIAEKTREYEHMRSYFHEFGPFGWHSFSERHVSTFTCKFDFHELPFDIQQCQLHFSVVNVPAMPGVHLFWGAEYVGADSEITGYEQSTAEWIFTEPTQMTAIEEYAMEPRPFGLQNTSFLVASFEIERRPGYLLENYVVTSVMVYMVSLLGLWIDHKIVPARAFAACVPVIIQSARITALSAVLPPISYQTRMSKFMFLILAIMVMHVLEFVMQHAVHRVAVRDSVRKDAEEPEGERPEASAAGRCEDRAIRCANRWLGVSFKFASPLVVVTGTLIIFLS